MGWPPIGCLFISLSPHASIAGVSTSPPYRLRPRMAQAYGPDGQEYSGDDDDDYCGDGEDDDEDD